MRSIEAADRFTTSVTHDVFRDNPMNPDIPGVRSFKLVGRMSPMRKRGLFGLGGYEAEATGLTRTGHKERVTIWGHNKNEYQRNLELVKAISETQKRVEKVERMKKMKPAFRGSIIASLRGTEDDARSILKARGISLPD